MRSGMLRRSLLAALAASVLAFAHGASAQQSVSREAIPNAGDPNLLALLDSMVPQQWLLVSAHGTGNRNSTKTSSGFDNDQLPRTLANFDGTPGCEPTTGRGFFTFGANEAVQNIVGNMTSNGFAFSRPVCDVSSPSARI